ncbi:MAG: hypothetical protein HY430_03560 [Candidatus Levybacteria bacterium]|nr:hypothetical protein [Candidatus Levybacteria bacterium]
MTEQGEEQKLYENQQRDEFATVAVDLLRDLRKAEDSVTFGPIYKTATKTGENLEMATLIYPNPPHYAECVTILAQNEAGKIVGQRTALFSIEEPATAHGHIQVLERGKGIATVLELAHLDMLQRLANKRGEAITYEVVSQNVDGLERAQAQAQAVHDGGLISAYPTDLINSLTEESQRWHSLWGPPPYGRLGFDHEGKRVFSTGGEGYEGIDVIPFKVEEVDENGRKLLIPLFVEADIIRADNNFIRERGKRLLTEVLVPKLTQISRE